MKEELVVQALSRLENLPNWSLARWDLLIRQADSASLLARLAVLLDETELIHSVPQAAKYHLEAALVLCKAQNKAVVREITHIGDALCRVTDNLILLKGAAYLLGKVPATKGRMFSDVDILVPRHDLAAVEAALMMNGWVGSHSHPYDQRYYRKWMHELPPMMHTRRQTTIDVHHAIVPTTARIKSDAAAIIKAAIPIEGVKGVKVLAPADMVLHSATHLFFNEEFSHGLRDLSDMDLLLRHFSRSNDFWTTLLQRARQLNLERPLYYCLRHVIRVFATPIPEEVVQESNRLAPRGMQSRLMDRLWGVALRPPHASLSGPYDSIAGGMLYLRSHWQKMPSYLLAYHLMHKALRREPKEREESPTV